MRLFKLQPRAMEQLNVEDIAPLAPGQVWQVSDPSRPSYIGPREPAAALTALAERMFEHMFAKQDSIICEPDELAERAWELAEAFVRAHTKRIK